MTSQSVTYASLIQGVSQQADISRGTASAEHQENCLNEVLDGVVSRMGTTVIAAFDATHHDPFVHQIKRNNDEKYLVMIEDGRIDIINKVTGQTCNIQGNIDRYLEQMGSARKSFQAVTIGDTTFLLNRQRKVLMGSERSPQRSNQGCIYIRAGGYSLTYKVTIDVGGQSFTSEYKTPDNSASANAAHIATDRIAEQFRISLTDVTFAAIRRAGLGDFTIQRIGSTLAITAPQGRSFDIRTEDGVGDTYLRSFTDRVRSITDLPVKCVNGYKVKVLRPGGSESESYYLEYSGGNDTGQWREIVMWDRLTSLDATTMPHLLVNTGENRFQLKAATWGRRVSGDGTATAVDPSFVGHAIRSLQFISGRLSLISESNMILSRSRNAYVYFPDTSQTNLDTAPIDYDISNGSSTDVEYAVVAGGKMQFWGDGQQTYLETGNDAIREDTTEVLPMANYTFDGEHPPVPSGMSSLTFSTAIGRWSKVTEVFLRNGIPQGEIVLTAHVPKYLSGSVKCIGLGDSSGKSLYLTDWEQKAVNLYQWYNQGQDRVQSSWNKWVFPSVNRILWVDVDGDKANFLFQWTGRVTLETLRLDYSSDAAGNASPIRLDHAVDQSKGAYEIGGYLILDLPYRVPQNSFSEFIAVSTRDNEYGDRRGAKLDYEFLTDRRIRVKINHFNTDFQFGRVPVARRTFSRLYAKDRQDQPIAHEKLLIGDAFISHRDTTEYHVRITHQDGRSTIQNYESRTLGDGRIENRDIPRVTGTFKVSVKEETENVTIELVNDSVFTSIWTSAKFDYQLTVRNT